jgi:hypothetical protein
MIIIIFIDKNFQASMPFYKQAKQSARQINPGLNRELVD